MIWIISSIGCLIVSPLTDRVFGVMLPEDLKLRCEHVLSEKLSISIQVNGFSPTTGGCINSSGKLDTNQGVFFLKWNDKSKFPKMFEMEARGLGLLSEAGELRIPSVIVIGESKTESFIILEHIESSDKATGFWEEFGSSLARLHEHQGEQFGLDHNNYIGSLPQSNTFHEDWIEFFIVERLEKQIEIAVNDSAVDRSLIKKFNNLYKKLPEIFPKAKPSLLHGDLWSGNYMVDEKGQACLIDPAVYYGNREIEISFTQLFGGYEKQFYDSYEAGFPLENNFAERAPVYNLYPLLVHVNLFGSGYLAGIKSTLNKF
ncbi:MAG: fructosamine kinase family protein [Bacteroidetes bacterium]|nr:fructosamine kinase family protein [Bacteroidota bacterium]